MDFGGDDGGARHRRPYRGCDHACAYSGRFSCFAILPTPVALRRIDLLTEHQPPASPLFTSHDAVTASAMIAGCFQRHEPLLAAASQPGLPRCFVPLAVGVIAFSQMCARPTKVSVVLLLT